MKFFFSLLIMFDLLAACAAPAPAADSSASIATSPVVPIRTLTVFAAASLTDSFKEIGKDFEKENPNTKVVFNFAGSQMLRDQLEQGATADVFASADQKQMDAAIASSLIANGAAKTFVTNSLVVITPKDNPAKIQKLEDLARPNLKIVLAAETVPVGGYARDSLSKMEKSFGAGYQAAVLKNVVSNEDNVKQVVAKVQLSEADAGIVYGTYVTPAAPLNVLAIPNEFNVVAQYPIAPLIKANQKELAAKFCAYLAAVNAQAILKKWGFGLP